MIVPAPDATGIVFDIKRCCLHDGPGIRATVFFKGCPLRCRWCHNPESFDFQPEIGFRENACTLCGACVAVCPYGCHRIAGGKHDFDRTHCDRCGLCVDACLYDALTRIGKKMSVQDALAEVLKDKTYFEHSGGGLTISGGEPLAQPAFALSLLHAAKQNGLHTCVETSGQVPFETLEAAAVVTDLFLFDCKETDAARHADYTGQDNARILDNLARLDALGAKIILRCPIIPGLNDRIEHLDGIAALANRLKNVQEIHLMPFHPFADYKSAMVGASYDMPGAPAPDAAQKQSWLDRVRSRVRVPVKL